MYVCRGPTVLTPLQHTDIFAVTYGVGRLAFSHLAEFTIFIKYYLCKARLIKKISRFEKKKKLTLSLLPVYIPWPEPWQSQVRDLTLCSVELLGIVNKLHW